MTGTMATPAEMANFFWHCEVAGMVLSQLPRNAATSAHALEAVRMATYCLVGRKGIAHASAAACEQRKSRNAHWHRAGLVREHAVPVGEIYRRVIDAMQRLEAEPSEAVDAYQDLTRQMEVAGLPAALIATQPRRLEARAVARAVREWTQIAWVTEADHKCLRAHGLTDRMPADWDGLDRFARYRACGIDVAPI